MPADGDKEADVSPSSALAASEGLTPNGGHFIHSAEEDDLSDQDNHLPFFLHLGSSRRAQMLGRILKRCRRDGDCLIWSGPTSGNGRGGGYGRFSFEGVTYCVHRFVYEVVYGPIPPRKQVDHKCSNRLCCRPDHLQHVTHKTNQKLRDNRRSEANK